MKCLIFSYLTIFWSAFSVLGQENNLSLRLTPGHGKIYFELIQDDLVIDTVFATAKKNPELIDLKIINRNKVLFIKKDNRNYFYYSLQRNLAEDIWRLNDSSGSIGINPARLGYYNPKIHPPLDMSYTILEEDKILIKDGKNEEVFDCKILEERRKALRERVEKKLRKN